MSPPASRPRGYHASGTWLDESRALLDAATPLDRLDPGPIERPTVTLGQVDVEALSLLAETMRATFAPMHEALEQLAVHWQREVVPALSAMCEQLAKVDAARRRQGKATARGRPDEYPAPPTRTR